MSFDSRKSENKPFWMQDERQTSRVVEQTRHSTIRLLEEPDMDRSKDNINSMRQIKEPWMQSTSLSPTTPTPSTSNRLDNWNEKKSFSSLEQDANRSMNNRSNSFFSMQNYDSSVQAKSHKDTHLSFMDSKTLFGSAIRETQFVTQDKGLTPVRPYIMRGLLKESQEKSGQSDSEWSGSLLWSNESQIRRRASPLRRVQGDDCAFTHEEIALHIGS
jgi:hypothetical protein